MSRHSIAEAQPSLPELLARAQRGEEIVIAAEPGPPVTLRVVENVESSLGPVDPVMLAWLESLAVRSTPPAGLDAGALVSQTRDEDWR